MKIKKYFNRYNKITVILMMFNTSDSAYYQQGCQSFGFKEKGSKIL